MQNPPTSKPLTSQKSKTKSRSNKRQRNRRKKKEKRFLSQQNKPHQPPLPVHGFVHGRSGADIWREAYENSIRWHAEHQGNFWRQLALKLETENEKLKRDLDRIRSSVPDCEGYEIEHPDLSSKEDSDEYDNDYLEFLGTTIQHQAEIRMTRQLEEDD